MIIWNCTRVHVTPGFSSRLKGLHEIACGASIHWNSHSCRDSKINRTSTGLTLFGLSQLLQSRLNLLRDNCLHLGIHEISDVGSSLGEPVLRLHLDQAEREIG